MELTHFDNDGNARMVDVTEKNDTIRTAVATGTIQVNEAVYEAVTAGIMGAKNTSQLIPMCHILPLSGCKITFEMEPQLYTIRCYCTVTVTGKTGVEMEALTGVSTALLTIYDMCKALDRTMKIGEIHLCSKTGGRSGNVVYR